METGTFLQAAPEALALAGAAALAAMLLLTPAVIAICRRFGLFDYPTARKRHAAPTPRLGGLAIAGGIAFAFAATWFLWPDLVTELEPAWGGILWAGLLILALGVYDDLVGAPAHLKLGVQVLAALLLCLWDFRFSTVYVPFVGRVGLGILSVPVTVLWIVAVTNSLNLIDGVDGLAAGVAAIGGFFLTVIGLLWGVPHVALLGAVIVGAAGGFLRFNYPPAQVFMGDSGSLLLGYLFAVASVSVPIKTLTVITMALPLLAVGFPLVELVISATRRVARGRSPLKADRLHWHHLLLRRGWSTRRLIWTYYAIAFGFGLFVPALRFVDRYYVLPIFVCFCVWVLTYLTGHVRERRRDWPAESESETPVEHARV
jgi:UDP-GlcNAc:undecaprenyl-phosphate GlcNAc-1-phosphate transferase